MNVVSANMMINNKIRSFMLLIPVTFYQKYTLIQKEYKYIVTRKYLCYASRILPLNQLKRGFNNKKRLLILLKILAFGKIFDIVNEYT